MFSNQDGSKMKGVKGGVDVDRGKNRREDMALSLRTRKRDELLEKRRNVGAEDGDSDSPAASEQESASKIWRDELTKGMPATAAELPSMVEKVRSDNLQEKLIGTQLIRKLLSLTRSPPIDGVIQSGVVPIIIESLRCHAEPRLQFEAAWALTNIASGTSEHTMYIVQSQAVPLIVELLESPHDDILEQAIWALGNIAGESAQCRDYVLGMGVYGKLLSVVTNTSRKLSLSRNAVWALSNLCRGKPAPDYSIVSSGLPVLVSLLHHFDQDMVSEACWGVSYLSDGPEDRVNAVIQSGAIPRLVQLLAAQDSTAQLPALRTIGNIVAGSDVQTQAVINHGALANFHFLIDHKVTKIRKEVCWAISNVAAGSREQIQALINANLIPGVIKLLSTSEASVRKEAVWTFSNLTTGGTDEQIQYAVDQGLLPPLCDILNDYDGKILIIALESIENILKSGNAILERFGGDNPYLRMITECGGLDKIEQLQNHNNNEVYHRAVTLLDTYFETEDDVPAASGLPSAPTAFGNPTTPANTPAFNF